MDRRLVFVASGGRTGTTFFGERLDEVIADCHSEHEPDVLALNRGRSLLRIRQFGLWHMLFGRMLGTSGLRVLGHRYMTGEMPPATVIRRLREQRAGYHASISEPLVVESSGRYWMVAPLLDEAYPQHRLICIARDPRDWVESWRRHQPKRHTKLFGGWFPLGPLTPKQIGDTDWIARWDGLSQFGRLAWDWRIIHRELLKVSATSPNARLFRFEDLFGEDPGPADELIAFAAFDGMFRIKEMEGFNQSVRNASKGPRRNWRDWRLEDVLLIDQLCGEHMQTLGYGQEPEWRELVEQAKVAARS